MIYFQQSCGTPSSQQSSRLARTGARLVQSGSGTPRNSQVDSAAAALSVQVFPGKHGRSWMANFSNAWIYLCTSLQKRRLRLDGCRWSSTQTVRSGKWCPVLDTLPGAHPGKSGSRSTHRPPQSPAPPAPQTRLPHIRKLFPSQNYFPEQYITGMIQEGLGDLGPLRMPQHRWRNLPALN